MNAPAPVVDAGAQQPTERFMAAPWLSTLLRWTAGERTTPTLEHTLAAMDDGGVDVALLSAWHGPQGALISNDEVARFVAAAPERFRGGRSDGGGARGRALRRGAGLRGRPHPPLAVEPAAR